MKIETKETENHYASYIPEYDIYFSTPKSKGMDEVHRRAKILVEVKIDFESKYGIISNRN